MRAYRPAWSRRRTLTALAGTAASLASARLARAQPGLPGADAAVSGAPGAGALAGKEALVLLNDRPVNAETPAHLLDDAVTSARHLFVRNNGLSPEAPDPARWTLTVDGEACVTARTFTLTELQTRFETHSYQLVIECAGNGRAEFYPPASGNQWTTGAVGCPRWTGVRVRDVLEACGIGDKAVYVGYYGADRHLNTTAGKVPISRGVPIEKALQDETLLCWAMNDEPLPLLHGYPLRLVCGGWPASTSGKWLTRLTVRDRVHDGPKMGGKSYRVPCEPVRPGAFVPDEHMCIIEAMPVKSLITNPRSGLTHALAEPLTVRGHAWAGERRVQALDLSLDFGATWQPARLARPANRLAWQRFEGQLRFPAPGYYEVWARATDTAGRAQPLVVPGWNPRGYLNNACHRIAVQVV